MSKPTFSPIGILAAIEGWDGPVSDNFDALKTLLIDGPFPLKEYAIADTLPTASNYDRCIAARENATAGWLIALSNGTTFRLIPVQAAAQTDSVAATVADLRTDFNALLAKLRTAGTIAP